MLCDNHYTCSKCGEEWTSHDCDSFHDDKCPECNTCMTPHTSIEFTEDGDKTHYHKEHDYGMDADAFFNACDAFSRSRYGKPACDLLEKGNDRAIHVMQYEFSNNSSPAETVQKLITERFEELILGCHSVMINFDHFCLEFNPFHEDGHFFETIDLGDDEIEINFTPELLKTVSVDSDGTWTIGDMTLEFFELSKVK